MNAFLGCLIEALTLKMRSTATSFMARETRSILKAPELKLAATTHSR